VSGQAATNTLTARACRVFGGASHLKIAELSFHRSMFFVIASGCGTRLCVDVES
jgi:hypothetical protein